MFKFTDEEKIELLKSAETEEHDRDCKKCRYTTDKCHSFSCYALITLDMVEDYISKNLDKLSKSKSLPIKAKPTYILNFPPEFSVYKNSEFNDLCKAEHDSDVSLSNGSVVDIEKYPQLKQYCTVSEEIDWDDSNLVGKVIKFYHTNIKHEVAGIFNSCDERYIRFNGASYLKEYIKDPEILF